MEFMSHYKKLLSIHNPGTNFGVLRKCPIWDIILRSPFVSMREISKLSSNFRNTDLRAREEENRLLIKEYFDQDRPLTTQVFFLFKDTYIQRAEARCI